MHTSAVSPRYSVNLTDAVTAAGPPLLFGFRLWASVCLALYVAFWLQLDNPFWAGTSAAIVCQPQLGASLRKGWFRMIGTVIGAAMIVVLTACFPQDRICFSRAPCPVGRDLRLRRHRAAQLRILLGGARRLHRGDHRRRHARRDRRREFGRLHAGGLAARARSASGSFAPASSSLGTDFGGAQRRLAALFADLAADIVGGFSRTLAWRRRNCRTRKAERRELVRRVIALDPIIDQALGESSHVRYHSLTLQPAVYGLFRALGGWRGVATHLTHLPGDVAQGRGGLHPVAAYHPSSDRRESQARANVGLPIL